MIQVFTLSLFMIVCISGLLTPSAAFALGLAMYVFEQALQGSVDIFASRTALVNIIVALSIGISAIRSGLRSGRLFNHYFNPIFVGTILIYFWYLTTMLWSPSSGAAMELIEANVPYFVLFVLVIPLLIREIADLLPAFRWTMLVGVCILGSILFNPSFTFRDGRLSLALTALVRTNPLVLGEFAGIVLIFSALITRGPGGIFYQGVRALAFIVGAIIALQSGSRGQLVFAIVVAVAFIPMARKVKSISGFFGTFALVSTVLAGTLFIASKVLFSDVLTRWDFRNIAQGSGHRLSNILELGEAWARQPTAWIFGLGGNAYSAVTATGGIEEYPHNIFAEIIAELGIPCIVLFLFMLGQTVRSILWLYRRYSDDPEIRIAIASLAALFTYEFFLTNKQGNLWSNILLFSMMIIVSRIHAQVLARDEEDAWQRGEEYEAGQILTDEPMENPPEDAPYPAQAP